jgi:hypothetical protein
MLSSLEVAVRMTALRAAARSPRATRLGAARNLDAAAASA